MAKSWETIKVDIKDNGVCVVTLNRPEKRNAMSPQLHRDMTDVLDTLRYEDKARVLVITGAGESFCAGMDLKQFFTELKDNKAEYDRITRMAVEWRARTLKYFPKPVIAMINGFCFGGAFSIVEGCDLAVAAEEATFGLSEINFKMFPGGSVSKSLANLIRPRDALFYGMTGRPFKGKEAERMGLVNYAVPKAELEANVMALAAEIASKDPTALRCTKDAYHHALNSDTEGAWAYTSALEAVVTLAQNNSWREEGIGDFLQGKYKPGLGGHEAVKK